jgi:hypothetical protein
MDLLEGMMCCRPPVFYILLILWCVFLEINDAVRRWWFFYCTASF